jgi:hypothetical protein
MDRRTLIALAVVVGALMVVLALVGGGGFSNDARALVQAESRKLSIDRKQFEVERQAVLDALAAEPDMFQPKAFDKTWPKRLDEAASRLDAADTALEQARAILAENDEKKRVDLEQTLERVRSARTFSAAEITEIAQLARQRLNLKRRFRDSVAKIETDYKATLAVDLQRVRSHVTQAVTTWPEKKADLEQRLEAAAALIQISETAWAQAQAAGAKPQAAGAAIDYDTVITAANTLSDNHRNLNLATITIKDLVSQLNVSWDKILADMEVREGSVVTFYHQLRKVTTPYVEVDPKVAEAEAKAKKAADESPVGSGSGGARVEETWVKVDKSRYLSMEKNLGMTIEHKPAGKYDSEATKTVQPAGYAYMTSPEKGRNRYGYWRHSGGSNFWVFYGQYAFMRSMFWGPSYYPIGVGHYRGYRGAYGSGRTWYGRDSSGGALYGSQGSRTKTTYSKSKYRRNSGYKSTQFVKSGGTYRGSKYAPKSSSRSSYSSSRYSSGRLSSRSVGRSRSRSFSGK